ncbi:MAG: hypothetical protein DRO93_05975 [Candidatus Thorarchaeota archaeon]|nr:MAG: hypothetical protein DRO93_05975 [Candidatus Thorarchaeota archaeon]
MDPNLLADWVVGIAIAISFSSALLLWDEGECTFSRYRICRLLFRGKARSILSSETIFLVGVALSVMLAPWSVRYRLFEALLFVVLLPLVGSILFLNVRIGPISWASRDRLRAGYLIDSQKNLGGPRDDFLQDIVGCILREARHGNSSSLRVLRELAERGDELGIRIREMLQEWSKSSEEVGELLERGGIET